MPGNQPLVSVILPIFNAEATLRETLASVSGQTYDPIEIVIVDDGSTDGSLAIAERFCARDKRARLIRQPNGGDGAARNTGFAAARGDFLAPIDADDLWHPDKLARQVDAARYAPSPPGLVYCWSRLIDEEGKVIGSSDALSVEGPALLRFALRNPVGNGSALLVSRRAALDAGGYDERLPYCSDMLFQWNVVRRWPVAAVPEYLVGYRVRPRGKSGNIEALIPSHERAFETFRVSCPELPHALLARNRAHCCFHFAEWRIAAGKYRGGARMLVDALRRDPLRTSMLILYRLTRTARRLLFPGQPAATPHFLACDPAASMRHDPHAIDGALRWIDRLDLRRMERLAAQEVPAPRAGSEPLLRNKALS